MTSKQRNTARKHRHRQARLTEKRKEQKAAGERRMSSVARSR